MNRRPPRLAEWLLTTLQAPDELVGDLHERFPRRGVTWYWREVVVFAGTSARRRLVRHPIHLAWHLAMVCAVGVAAAYAVQRQAQPNSGETLLVEVERTGWLEVRRPADGPLVVPVALVRLTNRTARPVTGVQVNAVFRRAADGIEWGNHWQPVARTVGLAPGETSGPVLLTAGHGHTGAPSAAAAIRHAQFVDARVQVFARYGSHAWAKLADAAVDRTDVTAGLEQVRSLESFVGAYRLPDGVVVRILLLKDGLRLAHDGVAARLTSAAPRTFIAERDDRRLSFSPEPSGAALVTITMQGRVQVGRRVVVPADDLRRWIGDYVLSDTMVMRVGWDGERLTVQAPGASTHPLFPESETRFFVQDYEAEDTADLEFDVDDTGRAFVLISQSGARQRAPRK